MALNIQVKMSCFHGDAAFTMYTINLYESRLSSVARPTVIDVVAENTLSMSEERRGDAEI